jgi:hypothetical protein
MGETITAKDLKKGVAFVKKGRGNRTVFRIVSLHRDGTISYAYDGGIKSFEPPVRILMDEFLQEVFGRQVESGADRIIRQRAEAAATAELIARTEKSQFTGVLMDMLLDAKAGKDIDTLTKKLEDFVNSEKAEANREGYDEGYEYRRTEWS